MCRKRERENKTEVEVAHALLNTDEKKKVRDALLFYRQSKFNSHCCVYKSFF